MVHTGRAAAGRRIVAPIWLVHSQRNTKNPLTIPLNDRSTTAAQEDLRVCWCLLLITDETGCCIFLERLFREHDVVLARRLLIPVINKIVTTTRRSSDNGCCCRSQRCDVLLGWERSLKVSWIFIFAKCRFFLAVPSMTVLRMFAENIWKICIFFFFFW